MPVKISHIKNTSKKFRTLVGAFIGSICYNTPAFSQVDHSSTEYEIILYDAETIARINSTEHSAPLSGAKQISPPTQEVPSPQQSSIRQPIPRDISSEFIDIIAGVPVMENPVSCGKGLLEIGLTIEGVSNDKGFIVADLHDDVKENFLVWDEVVLRVRATALKGETKFCMPLTKPGDYAIAIYHDKNENKEFDKNFLGIPSEHFGMSNNPKFGFKSPEFEDAVFSVPDKGTDIRITLLKAGDILGGQKK